MAPTRSPAPWAVGLALVLALVVGYVGYSLHAADSSGPGPTGTSSDPAGVTAPGGGATDAYERALGEISPDGTVGAQASLDLFQAVFGGLPGVPETRDPGLFVPSGTLAFDSLSAHRATLTTDQQVRLAELTAGFAAPAPGAPTPTQSPAPLDTAADEGHRANYTALVAEAKRRIESHLGPLGLRIDLVFSTESNGITAVFTDADLAAGTCTIVVLPRMQDAPVEVDKRTILAREVAHCFEAESYGDEAAFQAAPPWVVEGSAAWIAATSYPGIPDTIRDQDWRTYLTTPTTPLFTRAYDAIGFWNHVDLAARSPWKVFPRIWKPGLDSPAVFAASGATRHRFANTWAPGLARMPDLGAAWDETGLDLPADKAPLDVVALVPGGPPIQVSAAPYTNRLYSFSGSVDIIEFAVDGHSRLADGGVDSVHNRRATYCVDADGCTCPDGSDPVPDTLGLGGAVLAVSGGDSGTTGTVTTTSLDQACGPGAPLTTPATPGAGTS